MTSLDFGLLGNLESVVDLDAEIPHGGFELRVPKKQLHGSQVSGSPIDQGWLGAPNRVRSVPSRVKTYLLDPAAHNASLLPGAKVRRRMPSAREHVFVRPQCRHVDPCLNGLSR
jgi:hypothetical protein